MAPDRRRRARRLHTHHRETRDLDLFFRQQTSLGSLVTAVREQLERDGLKVAVLRTSPTFSQLVVAVSKPPS
jgi:hypothetical protein